MRLDNLLIEVRDPALGKVGVIRPQELELEASLPYNGVGKWLIRVAGSHPLAGALMRPGGGVVATDMATEEVIFSGPSIASQDAQEVEDGTTGKVEVSGITDTHVLADYLIWTDPTIDLRDIENEAENVFYTVTGTAESAMHELVDFNMGASALPYRKLPGFVQAGNEGRGELVSKEYRYAPVLEGLSEIALAAGLGFQVIQRGNVREFTTYAASDRTKTLRLSVNNRRLKSSVVSIEAPGVTRVIVSAVDNRAGYIAVENEASLDAAAMWNRTIETFAAANMQGAAPEQLIEVGTEPLNESGFTNIAAQAVAIDHEQLVYGKDWRLGDLITVEIEGREAVSQVSGLVMKVGDNDGLQFGMTLGDATGFDLNAHILSQLSDASDRIAGLERQPPVTVDAIIQIKTFNFAAPSDTWTCLHDFGQSTVTVTTLRDDGQVVIGDVTYPDNNTAVIHWFRPMAGVARIQR